jgi:hypothetical protein
MTDEGAEQSGTVDVDERIIESLRTADRPRHLASEVSEALDLPRGRVRTRLQALADDGRVVRTDEERTARWAVPARADEPEPEPAAGDGPEEKEDGGDTGDPDADATEGADLGAAGRPDGNGEPAADDAVEDEGPDADRPVEGHTGDADRTGSRDGTDAPATAEGPAATPGRPTGETFPGSPGIASGEDKRRWRGPAGTLALLVGLAVALVALGRLRRRR